MKITFLIVWGDMMNCNIRCTNLSNLLRTLDNERFSSASVQGLCTDLTGSLTAGVILYRLLYWWQQRPAVYKSWRDWENELRIKRSASQAADSGLKKAGVDIWVSNQSNGKPTKHYKLNLLRFIRRLAEVLGMRGKQVIDRLRGKPMLEESANVCLESAQTLTTESTLPTTTEQRVCSSADALPGENLGAGAESAAPALEGKDVEPIPAVARQLFNDAQARLYVDKYGADRVAVVCRYALNPPTTIHNPAGWAVDALRDRYILDKPKADYTTYASPVQQTFQLSDDETEENSELPKIPDVQPACTSDSKPFMDEQIPPAARRDWDTTYDQLSLQFDRASFDTYLRGVRLIAIEEDCWRVAVRNAHVRDMCQHRLYRNIHRVLSDVTGISRDALRLEFVAPEGGQAYAAT